MREILFRGQTRKYGEKVNMGTGEKLPGRWVYGGIFPETGDFSVIYGWDDKEEQTGKNLKKLPVYSDTVCQYTGLHDKNGAKIFEGDILKWDEKEWGEPKTEIAEWDYDLLAMRVNDWREFCEVIGNIHDNPELLEVKK